MEQPARAGLPTAAAPFPRAHQLNADGQAVLGGRQGGYGDRGPAGHVRHGGPPGVRELDVEERPGCAAGGLIENAVVRRRRQQRRDEQKKVVGAHSRDEVPGLAVDGFDGVGVVDTGGGETLAHHHPAAGLELVLAGGIAAEVGPREVVQLHVADVVQHGDRVGDGVGVE